MNGGPSHVDTWDHKPELQKRDGQPLLDFDAKTGFFPGAVGPLMKSPFEWARHGQSGTWASSLFPNLAKQVDRLAFIHSMHTEAVNHAPGQVMMNTGSQNFGRPSFGAWSLYGLGSESENLPGYIVLASAKGTSGGASNYGCVFLPTTFAGTPPCRPCGTSRILVISSAAM